MRSVPVNLLFAGRHCRELARITQSY